MLKGFLLLKLHRCISCCSCVVYLPVVLLCASVCPSTIHKPSLWYPRHRYVRVRVWVLNIPLLMNHFDTLCLVSWFHHWGNYCRFCALKLRNATQSCDSASSKRNRGKGTEMVGGRRASLWSSASLRTICLVLARHSALLSISAYKYIHFSHFAFQRSRTPRWVTLTRRWEARADWSRSELWERRLPVLHWWGCWRCGRGCTRFDC